MGEGYHLEFKESVDKSLVKEVCACANADGGTLLIGVTDKQQIKQIQCDNRLLSQVQDSIRQIDPKIKVSITPLDGVLAIKVYINHMDVQTDFSLELEQIVKS